MEHNGLPVAVVVRLASRRKTRARTIARDRRRITSHPRSQHRGGRVPSGNSLRRSRSPCIPGPWDKTGSESQRSTGEGRVLGEQAQDLDTSEWPDQEHRRRTTSVGFRNRDGHNRVHMGVRSSVLARNPLASTPSCFLRFSNRRPSADQPTRPVSAPEKKPGRYEPRS